MNEEPQYDKKFQKVFGDFKDYYTTEDYKLTSIDEKYLPFWVCKQEIVVETNIEVDRFSRILLELVNGGVKTHTEICQFLGIKEDDFTLMQLNFLISNDFLEEIDGGISYEITHNGRNFLDGNKNALVETENIEFEYTLNDCEYLTEEKFKYFYNDLASEFFDKNQAFDNKKSDKNNAGYILIQTHKIDKKDKDKIIAHKNKPTLNKIDQSAFVEFFNKNNSDGTFYDFGKPKIEAHKRSIKFLELIYQNDEGETKIEIRHCKQSVKNFENEILEEKLSKLMEKV
jgi:predicted transcriptional regulator